MGEAPIPPYPAGKIARWIDELDGDSFQVRESAMRGLGESAEHAEIPLRRAFAGPLSVEAKRRVKRLLDRLPAPPHPSTLAVIRSLELLESINTSEDRRRIRAGFRKCDPVHRREVEQTRGRLKR